MQMLWKRSKNVLNGHSSLVPTLFAKVLHKSLSERLFFRLTHIHQVLAAMPCNIWTDDKRIHSRHIRNDSLCRIIGLDANP